MKKNPLPNEAELLIQLTRGNEEAFRQVYQHYSTPVYRVAYRYLHVSELAEDVVQEIFLSIWNKRSEFAEVRALQAYLFSMTRNLCLRHIREFATASQANAEFFERNEMEGVNLLEPYHELLQQIVEELPPQQKRVFELAKIQGLSHDKIAEILNLSASTVNNHITAAMKSIKLRLQHTVTILILFVLSLFQ